MTLVDFAFLGILLLFAVGGVMRGLVGEVISLIAVFAAVWAGVRFGPVMVPLISGTVEDPAWRNGLGALLAGFIVWVFLIIVGRFASNAIGKSFLSGINRFFGLLFGVGRALVLIGFTTLAASAFGFLKGDWWEKSATRPLAEQTALLMERVVDVKGFIADQMLDLSTGLPGEVPGGLRGAGDIMRQVQGTDPPNDPSQEP